MWGVTVVASENVRNRRYIEESDVLPVFRNTAYIDGGGAYLPLTLSVSQVLVLVSSPPLGLMTRYLLLLTFAGFVSFLYASSLPK
jgi:hypothetical protein